MATIRSWQDTRTSFHKGRLPEEKQVDMEEKLAKELQRIKLDNESKQRHVEKICGESEELKALKEKLTQAYLTKERSAQVAEKKIRRLDELKTDAEVEDYMLQHNQKMWELEQLKDKQLVERKMLGKEVLIRQMQEKQDKAQEAYQQYLVEKEQVNKVVMALIDEDRRAYETDQMKKRAAFQDMLEALSEKAQRITYQKQFEKEENARYVEYMKKVERREEEHRAMKAELEAAKEKIFAKLTAEEAARQKDREQLEDLRLQLYLEEWDANERKKETDEIEKKKRHKEMMLDAEKLDKAYKQDRKDEELRMEHEFRKKMMEKFTEEQRLEQLTLQRRRQKEFEFKKEVEKMWQEKLVIYRAEREKEALEARMKVEEARYNDEVVRQEKERLLREHLPNLDGFLPKGVLKRPEEAYMLNYATKNGGNGGTGRR